MTTTTTATTGVVRRTQVAGLASAVVFARAKLLAEQETHRAHTRDADKNQEGAGESC